VSSSRPTNGVVGSHSQVVATGKLTLYPPPVMWHSKEESAFKTASSTSIASFSQAPHNACYVIDYITAGGSLRFSILRTGRVKLAGFPKMNAIGFRQSWNAKGGPRKTSAITPSGKRTLTDANHPGTLLRRRHQFVGMRTRVRHTLQSIGLAARRQILVHNAKADRLGSE
jgi:hypothetical protein